MGKSATISYRQYPVFCNKYVNLSYSMSFQVQTYFLDKHRKPLLLAMFWLRPFEE